MKIIEVKNSSEFKEFLNFPLKLYKQIKNEKIAKQKARVVCICKGINLGQDLKGLKGCKTIEDVNKNTGTGSGGCKGQRCSPRIEVLLDKLKDLESDQK